MGTQKPRSVLRAHEATLFTWSAPSRLVVRTVHVAHDVYVPHICASLCDVRAGQRRHHLGGQPQVGSLHVRYILCTMCTCHMCVHLSMTYVQAKGTAIRWPVPSWLFSRTVHLVHNAYHMCVSLCDMRAGQRHRHPRGQSQASHGGGA